ncbi:MAG: hypothetical protein NW226_09870 [Microscillaceae bacterium]|nr:hypothetical protein [Microscillaceae bacterium]
MIVDQKLPKVNQPVFKIYQSDFICDVCGEETCMGLIDPTSSVKKICDICLINGQENALQSSQKPPQKKK